MSRAQAHAPLSEADYLSSKTGWNVTCDSTLALTLDDLYEDTDPLRV